VERSGATIAIVFGDEEGIVAGSDPEVYW
jgi:hypothetical protein